MPRGRRRYAIVVLALAVIGSAAHWPALRAGLIADDYLQRSMLDGSYPVQRSPLDLFAFADSSRAELGKLMDAGTFPWWSHPELKLTALRPLSSLLIALDVKVLRLSTFQQHLHSLLWWLALLVLLAAFLRKRVPTSVALTATAILAFDPSSVTPIGWLANRNAIVSAVFGLAALWAHAAWRERGLRYGALLVAALFALSLAGGEYALGMFGYLLAYEVVAGSGGWKQRLRALVPATAPLAAYLALHVALGYGARGSSIYIDPLRRPLLFAHGALLRFPALVVDELLNIPGELTHVALVLHFKGVLLLLPVLALIAAVAPGAIKRLEAPTRKTVLFLLLGSALSMFPALGTMPSPRLLMIPGLGGGVFIAVLMRDAVLRFRDRGAFKRPWVWVGGLVGVGLFGSHILGAPLGTYASASGWTFAQQLASSRYLHADLDDRKVGGQVLVLLSSTEPITLIYPPYVRHAHGSPMPEAWRALSTSWSGLRVQRTARDTLELSADQSGILQVPPAGLLRSADLPFRAGQRFHVRGMDVQILAMDSRGPKRIRYRFDGDLDSPRFVFLTMGDNGLGRVKIPPPGRSLHLAGIPKKLLDAFTPP